MDRATHDLVAIVAHDLRAPVGVLHGITDLLLRDWARLEEGERLRLLQLMAASCERLGALVDDVLDVARIDAGQLRYELTVVDAGAVLQRAVDDVDPEQRRVTAARPDAPAWVRVDEQRLWQVVVNLLTNALKFSPPTEPVEAAVTAGGGVVRIAVIDHGMGIPRDEQPRLFQRFSRISRVNSPAMATGTGLGLFIARSLVEAQGGAIGVDSDRGHGATFWITFPQAPAPA